MTPIALVILHGALAWVTLAIAWTGAAAGVAFSLGWVNAPRAVTTGSYLLLGWVAIIMLPQVLGELTITPLLLRRRRTAVLGWGDRLRRATP